jgi:hypothetical protein
MKRFASACVLVLAGFAQAALADSPGPQLNPDRAYPPSCLAYPLPAAAAPVTQVQVLAYTIDQNSNYTGNTEQITLALWRSPCNGSKAALLGSVTRDPSRNNTFPAPLIPGLYVNQNGHESWARIAADPNTFRSGLGEGIDPFFSSLTFVFEEPYDTTVPYVDYTNALSITNGAGGTFALLGAYNPAQYPTSGLPLQISGYQIGNYSDPTGGQGVQVEISESSTPNQRYLILAWYTYDPTNIAFWLFGSTPFNIGDRSTTASLNYYGGGHFAGGGGVVAGASPWGSATVSFPDCDHMVMTYASTSGLPGGVPSGSGTRTFTRVTWMNGVTCDLP